MVVPTIALGPSPLPLLPVSLTDSDAVACGAASVICPESLLSADTVACAEVMVPAGIVILATSVVCAKIDVCTTIDGRQYLGPSQILARTPSLLTSVTHTTTHELRYCGVARIPETVVRTLSLRRTLVVSLVACRQDITFLHSRPHKDEADSTRESRS